MAAGLATNIIKVVHSKEPKEVIWADLKKYISRERPDQDTITPTSGDVLICVYERPKEIDLGNGKKLLTPDNYTRTAEDKFQGVVGLIVKVGPDFGKHKRSIALEPMPKVGDWVAFKTTDCIAFVLGERSMRLLEGQMIRMVLTDPDCII